MKQKHVTHAKRISFKEAVEKYKADVDFDKFNRKLMAINLRKEIKTNIIDHPFTQSFLGSKSSQRLKQELVDIFPLVSPVVWLHDKKHTCLALRVPAVGVEMDCSGFSIILCYVSKGGRISFTAEQAKFIKDDKFYLEEQDTGGIACDNGVPVEFTGLNNALKFLRHLLEKEVVNNFVARKQLRPFTKEEEMIVVDVSEFVTKTGAEIVA